MAAEIFQIFDQNLGSQVYESQDTNLIPSFNINTDFSTGSYIEYFVYNLSQDPLYSEYNYNRYTIINDGQAAGNGVLSQLTIDPESDLTLMGFNQGNYIVSYNFFNKNIGSYPESLYITEISSDRTEIRLDSIKLSDFDIIDQTNTFIEERENSDYFLDFYLNFGDNILCIANNIVLDDQDPNNPTILIKLYEPLPDQFDINSTLWIVTSIEEPVRYQINFIEEPVIFDDTVKIKGPNFNIELKDQVNNSTQELTYIDLISTSLTSSQNQLNSLLEEKEIDINIDWTNFEDFIHFSSAQTRLENFYYKINLIEQYSSSISILNNTTSSSLAISQSTTLYQSKIDEIITNFDGWDYYLYYSSGSWAWPKLNSEPPYQLATTGSIDVLNWFGSTNPYSPQYGGIILSASLYDENNKDNLLFSIPEYLREDPDNAPYELFIDMVAQHFDNIWIYYKDVTQKFNADNRLESGISKDIVADAIRDFGIKLYQNNFSNQDLYTAFLGLTPEGGLFPFPNITGSLPTPSGFEYIDTLVSASNDYIPLDDVNKSLYKRIYHNLPYLLKAKGTLPGLRALITSYGIPDTILRINEYGGKDKVDSNDWDYWQNEFNFAYSTEENNFISSSWVLHPYWYSPNDVPSTLAFRFQTTGLPYTNIRYSQSLWSNDAGSSIVLTYTGSAYTSGSYSGSIKDPYYQYATLTFYPNISSPSTSSNVYLPFFDGGWWSVMVNRSGSEFTLSAANKIYEGGDNGTILGFYQTSSITGDVIPWIKSIYSYFPLSFSAATVSGYDIVTYDNTAIYDGTGSLAGSYEPFSGSYQEIRYYNSVISSSVFKDYVMNPYSIEGNSLNSAPNELAFRASIGGEFYTGSISIHPKITGSWVTTHSFAKDSNFYYDLTPIFKPNTEYFFFDQPVAGIKNAVSDKIRLENDNLPSGSVLSPFKRLAQTTEASASYTPNINLLEVAFSPQDEINDDINSSIGFFNIGNFIGDPAFRSSRLTSYPDLDQLRNEYFEKYTKNYNLVDFIRLIKFFDNSLFKMIRDFIPARTSLASGIVIKQTLLERNRYPEPQTSWEDLDISGTLKPQWNGYNPGTVENFSGGTGGSFEIFNGINTSPYGVDGNGPDNRFGITQSWNEIYPTLSGSVTIIHDSQDEFYNGEFSGSTIIVTTQTLNPSYPVNYTTFEYKPVHYYSTTSNPPSGDGAGAFNNNDWLNYFVNPTTSPPPGEIYFYNFTTVTLSPFSISHKTRYIKIAKTDCNGNNNNNILENANSILVYNSIQGNYKEYKITLFGEGADFILFKCQSPYISFTNITFPNQTLDYTISASKTINQIISSPTLTPINGWDASPSGTNLPHYGTPYFNTSSGLFTLENTPNTRLSITASITTDGTVPPVSYGKFNIIVNGTTLVGATFDVSSLGVTTTLSTSYYGLEGDQLSIQVSRPSSGGGSVILTDAVLLITQSRAVESVSCSPIAFFEPTITEANFYNSDENALINNAVDNRQSFIYQDMDYTQGILTPVNFEELVNGTATRAAVQDSNYTLKRHINPRYDGSRTTSRRLNVWSPSFPSLGILGDEGTYGKLPTIDSTKTYVAYCDFIGGWPPERMNASGAHILYLIGEDGNVIIPNTSENSLYINKGTFESGERISISSQTTSTNGETNYRNIIRGGTRIEPILYTQIGHTPASWAPSMSLVSSLPIQDTSSYNNYQAKYSSTSYVITNDNTFYTLPFTTQISLGSGALWNLNRYVVTPNTILDNIDLTFNGSVIVNFVNNIGGESPPRILNMTARLVKDDGVNPLIVLDTNYQQYSCTSYNTSNQFTFNLNFSIPSTNLNAGDEYFIQFRQSSQQSSNSYPGSYSLTISPTSLFNITQYPTPTNYIIDTTGSNEIWGYPDPINYPYIITSSHPVLVASYGDPYIKQENISGSGFNPIELPWSIKYGDEFRFEGNENQVYAVKAIYEPGDNPNRLFNSSSIEVHFGSPLPVSASSSIFNLDHFLIRRYTDDASLILFEGYKPTGAEGPFIIKPEFVSPKLNKSIDQFIVDLTQKGLL